MFSGFLPENWGLFIAKASTQSEDREKEVAEFKKETAILDNAIRVSLVQNTSLKP